MDAPLIAVAASHAREPAAAAREAMAGLRGADAGFILAFLPPHLPAQETAAALRSEAGAVPVFGCTTAGQITPAGYEAGALLLLAFPERHFAVASLVLPSGPLPSTANGLERVRALLAERPPPPAGWQRLALILADGLSRQEDMLVASLQAGLGDIPIYGGSAGDGLDFAVTHVLADGVAHEATSLMLLVETDLEFRGLGFDHFTPTDCRMVVTQARPEERLVLELNGAPAAREYARLVGCPVSGLSPRVFAENPMLVRQDSNFHVRAVLGTGEDGGLVFLGAIDDGLILTLGRGKEIVRTLAAGLDLHGEAGQEPALILGFDCVLRRLEIEGKGLSATVSALLRERRVVGFSTYGEQHCGVHVNQTFVGVAFFPPVGTGAPA